MTDAFAPLLEINSSLVWSLKLRIGRPYCPVRLLQWHVLRERRKLRIFYRAHSSRMAQVPRERRRFRRIGITINPQLSGRQEAESGNNVRRTWRLTSPAGTLATAINAYPGCYRNKRNPRRACDSGIEEVARVRPLFTWSLHFRALKAARETCATIIIGQAQELSLDALLASFERIMFAEKARCLAQKRGLTCLPGSTCYIRLFIVGRPTERRRVSFRLIERAQRPSFAPE